MDGGATSPSLKGEALVTQIRSAVMAQGYIVAHDNGVLYAGARPEPAEFVALLGLALTRTERTRHHAHVMQLLVAVAKAAAERQGAVRISVRACLLLLSYARNGAPPEPA
jgi:hypothetical protein